MALFQDEAVACRSEEQARAEPVHPDLRQLCTPSPQRHARQGWRHRAPGSCRKLRGRVVLRTVVCFLPHQEYAETV